MRTSKLFFTCAALLAGAVMLQAEGAIPEGKPEKPGKAERADRPKGERPEGRRAAPIMDLVQKLDLTDQQKTQIKELNGKHREAMKALREDEMMSREDKQAKMREMQQAHMESVRAVLTPAQREQLETLIKEHREAGPKGDGPKGEGPKGKGKGKEN